MTIPLSSAVPQITLASASPRRRELLDQIKVCYEVLPVNIDESHQAGETAEQFVKRLAMEKAQAAYEKIPLRPALGSDTIVVLEQKILGKPENRQMGLEMLAMLSGKTHQVMTAVAIVSGKIQQCVLSTSEVEFSALNSQQIVSYWEAGESVDKAGAYAVQGQAARFIKNIKGSYSGIMGLPLFETSELLKVSGVELQENF